MASKYVYEGVGSNGDDGSVESPWATMAYAVANHEADPIYLKSTRVGPTTPNLGLEDWARCYFVDAASGTDAMGYGYSDGTDAWATLQYALDQVDCTDGSSAWIFCTGTETVTARIDLDTGSADGGRKIVEGYTSTPRDGGYYVLASTGAQPIQWYNVSGVVLANLQVQGYGGYGVHFGSAPIAGNALGQVCWNVKVVGGAAGFISQNSANSPILIACVADGCQYGYLMSFGAAALSGCVARGCTVAGVVAQTLVTCVDVIADGCAVGFSAATGAKLTAIGCLAYGCTASGFDAASAAGCMVAVRCVATDCGGWGFARQAAGADTYAVLLNSLAHGNTSGAFQSTLQINGLLTADPLLVDAAGDDFQVAAGSPCINGGVAGLHAGLTGQAVHIGPYSPYGVFAPGGLGAKVAYPSAAF